MRALKHSSITLHRGCPLLLFLRDGLHHYPNIVFRCALTGGAVNMTVSGFMFPAPGCHQEKRKNCLARESSRLICNGPPGLFDACVSSIDEFD